MTANPNTSTNEGMTNNFPSPPDLPLVTVTTIPHKEPSHEHKPAPGTKKRKSKKPKLSLQGGVGKPSNVGKWRVGKGKAIKKV